MRMMFEPKLNGVVAVGYDRRGACTGKATGPETSEAACRRTRESPRCSLPRDNSESAPRPLEQEGQEQIRCYLSEDCSEGSGAFFYHRPTQFQGQLPFRCKPP